MKKETQMTIIGNLTADPEQRSTGNGMSVTNLTVASTTRSYNKSSNKWEDGQSLFMRCTAWRDLADNIAHSLSKGMRVIAVGRLSQRSYQAQDGSNRTVVELTVDSVGPDLSHATAQVTRNASRQQSQQRPAQSSAWGNDNGGWQ